MSGQNIDQNKTFTFNMQQKPFEVYRNTVKNTFKNLMYNKLDEKIASQIGKESQQFIMTKDLQDIQAQIQAKFEQHDKKLETKLQNLEEEIIQQLSKQMRKYQNTQLKRMQQLLHYNKKQIVQEISDLLPQRLIRRQQTRSQSSNSFKIQTPVSSERYLLDVNSKDLPCINKNSLGIESFQVRKNIPRPQTMNQDDIFLYDNSYDSYEAMRQQTKKNQEKEKRTSQNLKKTSMNLKQTTMNLKEKLTNLKETDPKIKQGNNCNFKQNEDGYDGGGEIILCTSQVFDGGRLYTGNDEEIKTEPDENTEGSQEIDEKNLRELSQLQLNLKKSKSAGMGQPQNKFSSNLSKKERLSKCKIGGSQIQQNFNIFKPIKEVTENDESLFKYSQSSFNNTGFQLNRFRTAYHNYNYPPDYLQIQNVHYQYCCDECQIFPIVGKRYQIDQRDLCLTCSDKYRHNQLESCCDVNELTTVKEIIRLLKPPPNEIRLGINQKISIQFTIQNIYEYPWKDFKIKPKCPDEIQLIEISNPNLKPGKEDLTITKLKPYHELTITTQIKACSKTGEYIFSWFFEIPKVYQKQHQLQLIPFKQYMKVKIEKRRNSNVYSAAKNIYYNRSNIYTSKINKKD